MFYSIILYFIHICIDCFINLQFLYRNIQRCVPRWFSFWNRFLPFNKLDKQVPLKKLPFHLGIIIKEDRISFSDISNIINWSLCEGIHHVSFYDDRGYIKKHAKKLYSEATLRKDIYFKRRSPKFNLIFSDGKAPCSYSTIIKNGHATKDIFPVKNGHITNSIFPVKNGHTTKDIYVYLLADEDGKQCIVNAAKNLCKDVTHSPATLQNFYAKEFDSYIKDVIDIPDPQLIITFGKLGGLIGYLPWHIRLSEILSHPTHCQLQFQQFKEFLFRYNRCQQRFGT